MTKAELIKELLLYPDDLEVKFFCQNCYEQQGTEDVSHEPWGEKCCDYDCDYWYGTPPNKADIIIITGEY